MLATEIIPTVLEPYTTEDGFHISEVRIIENARHDFRIEAVIDGKSYKYIAGRKSVLAAEIVRKGRDKMSPDDMKTLVEQILLPLAKKAAL